MQIEHKVGVGVPNFQAPKFCGSKALTSSLKTNSNSKFCDWWQDGATHVAATIPFKAPISSLRGKERSLTAKTVSSVSVVHHLPAPLLLPPLQHHRSWLSTPFTTQNIKTSILSTNHQRSWPKFSTCLHPSLSVKPVKLEHPFFCCCFLASSASSFQVFLFQ